MEKITTISGRVLRILQEDPKARSDDDYLICEIYKEFLVEHHIEVCFMSWEALIKNRKALNLPSFESIRRSRQKVQEKHPSLRANAETQAARDALQDEYLEFARS